MTREQICETVEEEARGLCSCDYMSSTTDLEAIKKEAEQYDIESTGCIEIRDTETEDAVLIYEKGEWHQVG